MSGFFDEAYRDQESAPNTAEECLSLGVGGVDSLMALLSW